MLVLLETKSRLVREEERFQKGPIARIRVLPWDLRDLVGVRQNGYGFER